jgi:hypothetical protein
MISHTEMNQNVHAVEVQDTGITSKNLILLSSSLVSCANHYSKECFL